MPSSLSLTVTHTGRAGVIMTPCWMSDAFDPVNPPTPQPPMAELRAIWDTGATNTCITQAAADRIGLVPTGLVEMNTANGTHRASTVLTNVALPNGVGFHGLRVTICDLGPTLDVLIGMDIIGSGDFAITNFENNTVMSFRIPSSRTIDFVVEHSAEEVKEKARALIKHREPSKHRSSKKTGRGKNGNK